MSGGIQPWKTGKLGCQLCNFNISSPCYLSVDFMAKLKTPSSRIKQAFKAKKGHTVAVSHGGDSLGYISFPPWDRPDHSEGCTESAVTALPSSAASGCPWGSPPCRRRRHQTWWSPAGGGWWPEPGRYLPRSCAFASPLRRKSQHTGSRGQGSAREVQDGIQTPMGKKQRLRGRGGGRRCPRWPRKTHLTLGR